MDDDRTRGWLMARSELAIAVIAVLILPIWWITQPGAFAPPLTGVHRTPLLDYYPIAAEIVMLLALGWMVRIWRGPTREAPPAWRYRDRD